MGRHNLRNTFQYNVRQSGTLTFYQYQPPKLMFKSILLNNKILWNNFLGIFEKRKTRPSKTAISKSSLCSCGSKVVSQPARHRPLVCGPGMVSGAETKTLEWPLKCNSGIKLNPGSLFWHGNQSNKPSRYLFRWKSSIRVCPAQCLDCMLLAWGSEFRFQIGIFEPLILLKIAPNLCSTMTRVPTHKTRHHQLS